MITDTVEGINKWRDDSCSWIRLINIGELSRLPNAVYALTAISVKIVLKMALHSSLPFPDQLCKQVLEASTPILKHFFSLWDVCWTTLHWVFWVFVIKKYVSWAQEDLRRGQLCSFLTGPSFRFNSASSSCPASCPTRKRPHNYLPCSLSWQVFVTRVLHISPPSIFHIPGGSSSSFTDEEGPDPASLSILPNVPCKEVAQPGLKLKGVSPKPALVALAMLPSQSPQWWTANQPCDPNTKWGHVESLSILSYLNSNFSWVFIYSMKKSDSCLTPLHF